MQGTMKKITKESREWQAQLEPEQYGCKKISDVGLQYLKDHSSEFGYTGIAVF